MIDQATNGDGDTARLKMLADWEHDDPAQEPAPVVYESHGPALNRVMADLRLAYPHPHGLASRTQVTRYCACCDDWKHMGPIACPECGAPWEKVA